MFQKDDFLVHLVEKLRKMESNINKKNLVKTYSCILSELAILFNKTDNFLQEDSNNRFVDVVESIYHLLDSEMPYRLMLLLGRGVISERTLKTIDTILKYHDPKVPLGCRCKKRRKPVRRISIRDINKIKVTQEILLSEQIDDWFNAIIDDYDSDDIFSFISTMTRLSFVLFELNQSDIPLDAMFEKVHKIYHKLESNGEMLLVEEIFTDIFYGEKVDAAISKVMRIHRDNCPQEEKCRLKQIKRG